MKARFRIDNPNMLAEAQVGDLFVPLGPDLVECVCALRCSQYSDGFHADLSAAARLNPDASLDIVVVACRVAPGEPEYYPPGFWNKLSGAAPITFLRQCEPLLLQARVDRQDTATDAAEAPRPAPLYADLDAMQRDMDHLNQIARLANHVAHRRRDAARAVLPENLARAELASKL
ncbi:MAG: hypothetical protein WA961_14580 [Rhodanobacter sp.]